MWYSFGLPRPLNREFLPALLLVVVLATAPVAQAQIHVDTDAGGNDDGTSWTDAFTDLQDALDVATGNDEIWIAEGTYFPDEGTGITDDDRSASFTVTGAQDGLEIFGGFAGGETDRSQRNPATNPVLLNGDIGTSGDAADNSFHVLFFDGTTGGTITNATVLDGVTVTNGNANGSDPNVNGGGLFCNGAGSGNACSPTLTGIAFTDNSAGFNGGAVFNDGDEGTSSPQITNATFTGNSAFNGGAIYNDGDDGGTSSPSIANSTFTDNTAVNGGAIFNEGTDGGVSSPSITNSTFINNSARSGGAIRNDGGNGTSNPEITGTIFTGNDADVNGGALFNDGSENGESSPTITGSTFSNNSANNGGAILNVDDATQNGNGGVSSPAITNTVFISNTADFDGGAMANVSSSGTTSPVITNATFTDNTASGDGGAMINDGRNSGTSSPQITNTILYGNSATNSGDEIFNVGAGATPAFAHTLIEGGLVGISENEGSSTTNDGNNLDVDPLFLDEGDPDGDDDTFATADDGLHLSVASPALDAGNNGAVPSGVNTDVTGAARIQNSTVDLGAYEDGDPALTIFVDAGASGADDGTSWTDAFTDLQDALAAATGNDEIWIAGGTYFPDEGAGVSDDDRSASFTVTGGQDGLGIFGGFASGESTRSERDPAANAVILSGDVGTSDDTADNSFHVLFFDGTTGGTITNATVLDGVTVTDGNADGSSPDDNGGGLFCDGDGSGNECSPTITNAIFTANSADDDGGAIFNDAAPSGTSSPTITNTTFSNNTGEDGGAMYNDGDNAGTSSPTMTNVTFTDNSATDDGGAIYTFGDDGSINNAEITDASFTGNSTPASGNGGAIFNLAFDGGTSSPTITDATFSGNSAGNGGAIYNEGNEGATRTTTGTSSPTMTNVVFTDNAAVADFGSGGAIFNFGDGGTSSPQITNATFSGNSAEDDGGAIVNMGTVGTSSPQITNSTFTNNSTNTQGGAISNLAFSDGTSSPQIINTTFTGNSADLQGGAIFNDGGDGTSSPTITNVILWNNTSDADNDGFGSGDEIFNDTATPTLSHTLIEGGVNGSGVDGGANTDGGNNLDADPLFVDEGDPDGDDDTFATADDGLHLLAGSPALNAGDDGALPSDASDLDGDDDTDEPIPFDRAGADRIQNGTVDLGAYEGGDPAVTIFVDADAGGNDDGTSWTDAFTDLQNALDAANGNDEIWIAENTYTPTDGTDRTVSFRITGAQDGLEIFGGFQGGETDRSQRDPALNPVVLSGDIGTADDDSDNSFHVLFFDGTGSPNITGSTVLDGVTVTDGNADGSDSPDNDGGGLYCDGSGSGNSCSPTVTNVTFSGNAAADDGGAVYNNGNFGTSSPTITSTTFSGNQAGSNGGAIFNNGNDGTSSPTVTSSVFSDNSAGNDGGAIGSGASSSTMTNVTFTGNSAADDGGAVSNVTAGEVINPEITNATFTANSADDTGGAIFNFASGIDAESSPQITNTILHGNSAANGGDEIFNDAATPTLNHTLIEGGLAGIGETNGSSTTGGNNVDADPLLVDPDDPDGDDDTFATDDDGLRLVSGSPALDAGDNAALPSGVTTDITGAARIQNGSVDLGAYEGALPVSITIDGTAGADGADAGWRFLGIPTSVPIQAGDLRLGGQAPSFNLPSGHMLQEWDDTQGSGSPTGGYDPIESGTETLQPGRGYAVFLFDEAPFALDPSMTIDVAGDPALRGNQGVTASGLAQSAQWHLLANPYPSGYDLSSLTDLQGSGFQASIQRFDAATGTFEVTTQSSADLSAWQGFFIERTDFSGGQGATNVTFDPAGRIGSAPFVGSKAEDEAPLARRARLGLSLTVLSAEGDTLSRDHAAEVVFDARATAGWDAFDASKLAPLASQYALVATEGTGREGTPVGKAVESRPWPSERQEIPLRFTTEGFDATPEATLSVRRWTLPEGWRARIVDTESDAAHRLAPDAAHTFSLAPDTTAGPRFELQVAPAGAPLPVELASFAATETGTGTVRLRWQTATETSNAGFEVQRRREARERGSAGAWEPVGFVEGAGTTQEPQTYRFADADVPFTADTLAYRLKQIDTDGTAHLSEGITVARRAVTEVQLHGSFPNPARSQATIQYALPSAQEIRLEVYDLLGRRVMTLASGRQKAGRKQLQLDVSRLASGTYFYRLTAGETTKTRKLTVVH